MNITLEMLYEHIGRLYVTLGATQTKLRDEVARLTQENDTLREAAAQNEELAKDAGTSN